MRTQTKFSNCLLTLILNSFSCEPNVPIIPKVGPLPNYKKLFL